MFSSIATIDVLIAPSEAEQEAAIAQQSFHGFTPATLDGPEALRQELAAIRAQGYGFDREEHEPGIICVAVPILSAGGRVLGGLSVTSSTRRTDLAAMEALAPRLQATARAIAEDAEGWHFPQSISSSPEGATGP